MRIGPQNVDSSLQVANMMKISTVSHVKSEVTNSQPLLKQDLQIEKSFKGLESSQSTEVLKDNVTKDKLDEAVQSLNDFLSIQHKSSKFKYHEGLDKYYVQLVDADTDEVIKEIPPERLLNAFYEMKKLAGMIVDEKI